MEEGEGGNGKHDPMKRYLDGEFTRHRLVVTDVVAGVTLVRGLLDR